MDTVSSGAISSSTSCRTAPPATLIRLSDRTEVPPRYRGLWRFYRRARRDPALWAKEVLGVELWSRQEEILRSVFTHRRTVVPAGHGVGKTFVSAVAVLAFLYLNKPSKVITTAPTWEQVRRLLWSEINTLYKERLEPLGFPGKMLMTQLRVRDDWFALGLSSNEAVRFQGFHQEHMLIVLDEAPGVRREIHEAADSLMSTGDAHMLMIGNPIAQQGPFYEACRSGEWRVLRMSCLDSPNLTGEPVSSALARRLVSREWVEEKARLWGTDSPQYQAKVLGRFPPAGSDQLIPLTWVEAAIERGSDENASSEGPTRLGVDVARYGDDATVYTVVRGNRVVEIVEDHGVDTMAIVGRIVRLRESYALERIGVDDIGVGGGVTDRLRELGVPVEAVRVGEVAIERKRFANRRAELWWNLREWVRTEGVLPRHPRLVEDLTAVKFTYTSKGQIELERKDVTKRRLGRSPDYGDSLMLALATDVSSALESFQEIDWGILPLARDFPT